MKIKVSRKDFRKLMTRAQTVIQRSPSIPVLGHVLLSATEENLNLTATDLQVFYRGTIPLEGSEAGRCLLPGLSFFKLLRATKEEEIEISASSDEVKISAGKSVFKFPALDPEDFPAFPEVPEQMSPVEPERFVEALSRVQHACSKDEWQGMNGVCLKKEDDCLVAVATDGHRVSIRKVETDIAPFDGQLIVPLQGVKAIIRTCRDATLLMVGASDNTLVVRTETDLLNVCLLQRGFPAYENLIADKPPVLFRAEVESILGMLKRVGIACDDKNPYVRVSINGALKAEAWSGEVEAVEQIHVDLEESDGQITAGYNIKYLLDAFSKATDFVGVGIKEDPPLMFVYENGDLTEIIAPVDIG